MMLRTWILLGTLCIGFVGILVYIYKTRKEIQQAPRMSDLIKADRLTTDHLIDEATKTAQNAAEEIKQLRKQLENTNGW